MTPLDKKLIEAAKEGNVAAIKSFIKSGANVNAAYPHHVLLVEAGSTALHWAARNGQATAIEALIQANANPNVHNDEGITPLHMAAAAGNKGSIEALIQAGANIEATDKRGITPLLIAAASDNTETLKALIKAKANVNVISKQGSTALHRAGIRGSLQGTEALIKAGANFTIKDYDGKTPLARAEWAQFSQTEQPTEAAITWSQVTEFLGKLQTLSDQLAQTNLTTLSVEALQKMLHAANLPLAAVLRVLDTPIDHLMSNAATASPQASASPLEACALLGRFDLLEHLLTHFSPAHTDETRFSLDRDEGSLLTLLTNQLWGSEQAKQQTQILRIIGLMLEQGAKTQNTLKQLGSHESTQGLLPHQKELLSLLEKSTQAPLDNTH